MYVTIIFRNLLIVPTTYSERLFFCSFIFLEIQEITPRRTKRAVRVYFVRKSRNRFFLKKGNMGKIKIVILTQFIEIRHNKRPVGNLTG